MASIATERGMAAAGLAVGAAVALTIGLATAVQAVSAGGIAADVPRLFGAIFLLLAVVVLSFAGAFAIAYLLCWVIGLPLHLALYRLGLTAWWAYAVAGGAATAAIALTFGGVPPPLGLLSDVVGQQLLLADFVAAGPLAMAVFWRVAVRPGSLAEAAGPPLLVIPLGLVGGFVAFVAFMLGLVIDGMCGNEVFQTVRSPDGALAAVVFERGCGVTSDPNTQVSIVPAGEDFDSEVHRSFAGIDDQYRDLSVRWTGTRMLAIRPPSDAKVYHREAEAPGGVAVTYE